MKHPDLKFSFEIYFIVMFTSFTVLGFLPVLAHHYDWGLYCSQTRKHQIKQDKWIRVESFVVKKMRLISIQRKSKKKKMVINVQLPPKSATLSASFSPKVNFLSSRRSMFSEIISLWVMLAITSSSASVKSPISSFKRFSIYFLRSTSSASVEIMVVGPNPGYCRLMKLNRGC